MTIQEIEALELNGYYTLSLCRDNIRFLVKLVSRFRHVITGKYCAEVESPQRDNYIVSPEDLAAISEETAQRFPSLTGYKLELQPRFDNVETPLGESLDGYNEEDN